MSLIETKRNELEQFIKEQMIGPGGCAGRFWKDGLPLGEEVINTTPGSIYSTAILFPKKENQSNIEDALSDLDAETIVEKDDDFTFERRFPNAIAISCCLNENADLNRDLQITISGRYYRKISRDDRSRVYISVPQERAELITELFQQDENLRKNFSLEDLKLYIHTAPTNDINTLNKNLARQFYNEIRENRWGQNIDIREEHLYLSTCRRILFDKLKDNDLFQHIADIKQKIDLIGTYEQIVQDLEDLSELYTNDGYGYWESKRIEWPVEISQIRFEDNKRSYCPDDYPQLKKDIRTYTRTINREQQNINMSLSVLLQTTKDYRNVNNRKKYIKVMLQNSTTPFVETLQDQYKLVNEELNKSCFFGVRIEIHSDYLEPYKREESYADENKEEDRLKFLYRDVRDYGIGHLCSVDWDRNRIWSEFIPCTDIPDVDFTPRNKRANEWIADGDQIVPPTFLDDNSCLNIHHLSTFSTASDNEIISDLIGLVQKYQEWINLLPIQDPNDVNFNRLATYTIRQCQKDCSRMQENINCILSQPQNVLTFRLMNSAMLMQMWHKKYVEDDGNGQLNIRTKPDFYIDKGLNLFWRPFQLAFILLNLDGIIQNPNDEGWKKRNDLVDLVWFPTGGGKTEAYLGLIALTIIHRRRTYAGQGGGTAAIMRYTLRLLATQQFQRALYLILALDQIRIWGQNNADPIYHLGTDAISIGLFVGQNSLPNTYDELDAEAQRWLKQQANKIPLNKDRCPWCGGNLHWTPRYGARYRLFPSQFGCQNDHCSFNNNRLPVQLCDDQICADPPTLLFGTVDKFAQLAHKVSTRDKNKDTRRLFGRGDNINYLTPDLIIQDELHLLLGPLGSAVSLFEAVIDQLCTRVINENGAEIIVRPKIISSTATTCNTELQIRALYDRDVNIFPKSGVDYDDSFFSFYKRQRLEDGTERWISKRRYMGITPTGRTQMLTQLLLAAMLFVHRAKFEKEHWIDGINDDEYQETADNYYSIISYFNSLREVGKTDAQYPYEFTQYLQRLYERVIGHSGLLDCYYADENTLSGAELTGRLSGQKVVETLHTVERSFDVNNRTQTPPDYILATNMISVGIDVARFNTIIMNSMPRNIAEYIQASSRVARSYKGLVITSHNPFRVRDVSHFEKFIEFHKKLYYYVEPISITPFSDKAIERYLPLYLATFVRHILNEYNGLQNNDSAGNVLQWNRNDLIDRIMEYFVGRFRTTQNITRPDAELQERLRNIFTEVTKVREFVENAVDQWIHLVQGGQLHYKNDNQYQHYDNVLFTETEDYDDAKADSLWVVPNALRIVEPEAVLTIENLY